MLCIFHGITSPAVLPSYYTINPPFYVYIPKYHFQITIALTMVITPIPGGLLLTLINLAWISNYIHHKVLAKIAYPFPIFNLKTVEVWELISNFIPHFVGHGITYLCWVWSLTMLVKEATGRFSVSSSTSVLTVFLGQACRSPTKRNITGLERWKLHPYLSHLHNFFSEKIFNLWNLHRIGTVVIGRWILAATKTLVLS